jgi:hypothetical protein
MLYQDLFIVEEVKKRIKKIYPALNPTVYYEETQDNYVFAIKEDDVYYSHDFLSLVTEIKMEYLWTNKIFNFLFVCESEPCCGSLLMESLSPMRRSVAKYKDWNVEQREDKVATVKSDLQVFSLLEMVA